jgi:hypothetical protein
MQSIMRTTASIVAMTLLLIAGGCGDSPPPVTSSDTEATVKGIVKIDGKPATEGEVVFNPANMNRPNAAPRTAPIGKDGSYSVKTLVGENEIRLTGAIAKTNQILQHQKTRYDVQNGENSHDVEFSTK